MAQLEGDRVQGQRKARLISQTDLWSVNPFTSVIIRQPHLRSNLMGLFQICCQKTTKDIKIPGIISHCCSSGMPGMPKVGVFRCGESIVGMVHRWARPGPPASVVLAPEKKPETMGLVGESQIFGTGWGCSLRGDGINYRYTTYIQLPLTQHSSN